MTTSEWAWHVHHNILCEPLAGPLEARAAYIRTNKPPDEVELRLRLLHRVRGPLPTQVSETWQAYREAKRTYDEVTRTSNETKHACDEAWQACNKARRDYAAAERNDDAAQRTYGKAERTYGKAQRAYDETERAYSEAQLALNLAQWAYNEAQESSALLALHATECPNCPWDGYTITGE